MTAARLTVVSLTRSVFIKYILLGLGVGGIQKYFNFYQKIYTTSNCNDPLSMPHSELV